MFNVELEGQTLCLLSPSLTTTVGHHSTNSIQSFFQRLEEATTTADDVGKHRSPGGGFNSLHSSSSNCGVFLSNISQCKVSEGSSSNQCACSLIHAATLQGSWIANKNMCQESFRSILKTSHLNPWSENDPANQGLAQRKTGSCRKLVNNGGRGIDVQCQQFYQNRTFHCSERRKEQD